MGLVNPLRAGFWLAVVLFLVCFIYFNSLWRGSCGDLCVEYANGINGCETQHNY